MSSKRILFIDGDEPLLEGVLAEARSRGFETVSTASSNDGFELARTEKPDLIVVNVELQPTNGWSVCTKLKKDEDLKGIPVVLTSSTSTADTFEKHKKLKTRADEYLLKPYQPDDLVRLAGQLVGLPEMPAAEEESSLGDIDEPLDLGQAEGGEEELISVPEDEPSGVEDPLAASDDLPAEEMAPEGDVAPEELPADEAALGTDSSGEEAADPLAATGDEEALAVAAEGEEAVISEDSPTELGAEEQATFAGEADDLSAFDQSFEGMAAGDDDITVAAEAPEELGMETVEGGEALPFEEAPLEIPADDQPPEAETLADDGEEQDSPFGETAFSEHTLALAVEPPEGKAAELESRVAALEAELAGYREADASRDAEGERLRGEISKKDREILDLKEQLHGREKTILEIRENESKLTAELAKGKEDKARREATVKSLTTKAEQLTQQAAKLQKDLLAAREEAKSGPALKAKAAELEKLQGEHAALQETAKKHESRVQELESELAAVKAELDGVKAELDETKFARDQVQSEADGLRQDLEEARKTAEKALANAVALQEKLAAAEERAEGHATVAKGHEESLGKTREALQKLLGELGA